MRDPRLVFFPTANTRSPVRPPTPHFWERGRRGVLNVVDLGAKCLEIFPDLHRRRGDLQTVAATWLHSHCNEVGACLICSRGAATSQPSAPPRANWDREAQPGGLQTPAVASSRAGERTKDTCCSSGRPAFRPGAEPARPWLGRSTWRGLPVGVEGRLMALELEQGWG